MNPFNLPGPQFLALYGCMGAAGTAAILGARYLIEAKAPPDRPLTDPYPIAYLRGGPKEAIRVATAVLIHREWLSLSGSSVKRVEGHLPFAEEPLERHILEFAANDTPIHCLLREETCAVADSKYEDGLIAKGVLPSIQERAARAALITFVILVLVATCAIKVVHALSTKHPAVIFLLILCAFFCGLVLVIVPRRTPAGTTALRDLQTLFNRLRNRARTVKSPLRNSDFAFLIAVFGLHSAKGPQYTFLRAVRSAREPTPQSNNSCSSCSSCSSGSSSSSCGGSCGGGCGGCGG